MMVTTSFTIRHASPVVVASFAQACAGHECAVATVIKGRKVKIAITGPKAKVQLVLDTMIRNGVK